jgi:hypothetical protein
VRSLCDERRLGVGRHVWAGRHWARAWWGRVDDNTVVESEDVRASVVIVYPKRSLASAGGREPQRWGAERRDTCQRACSLNTFYGDVRGEILRSGRGEGENFFWERVKWHRSSWSLEYLPPEEEICFERRPAFTTAATASISSVASRALRGSVAVLSPPDRSRDKTEIQWSNQGAISADGRNRIWGSPASSIQEYNVRSRRGCAFSSSGSSGTSLGWLANTFMLHPHYASRLEKTRHRDSTRESSEMPRDNIFDCQ